MAHDMAMDYLANAGDRAFRDPPSVGMAETPGECEGIYNDCMPSVRESPKANGLVSKLWSTSQPGSSNQRFTMFVSAVMSPKRALASMRGVRRIRVPGWMLLSVSPPGVLSGSCMISGRRLTHGARVYRNLGN
jgi:hypothetical protein